MNAANILKPALSRGEIQVIGATTLVEYRKYIEKDSALERRFQPVIVNEPSIEDAVEIINRIAGQKIVQAIINKPDEEWTDVALDKLLREANAMTKAVAYKQRIDVQNKEDVAAAADELKAEFFNALGAEHPDLYRQLVQILDRRTKEVRR